MSFDITFDESEDKQPPKRIIELQEAENKEPPSLEKLQEKLEEAELRRQQVSSYVLGNIIVAFNS